MKETFLRKGERFVLPELSDKLALGSDEFLVQQIFQGGMGTCAKIQNSSGQVFALKIIHTDLLEDNLALRRYIEEMKTWLTLSACDGVVEALCLIRINDIPCIAAKWMDNGNMRPFIVQKDAYLFYTSIDRIASTLNWAYSNYSIIHRDLKPENILLDKSGNAFIADWGLSRPISQQSSETDFANALNKLSNRIDITEAGSFLGTILYASPEQILGLKNIDHRSDIYSLGCIMYEWETGTPPFIANNPQEIALQHLRSKPKRIGGFLTNTNFKVEKIIMKCLEKNPEKRFQTYQEFISAFRSIAKKNTKFKPFVVAERYQVPIIGQGEFKNNLEGKKFKAIYSPSEEYALIEFNDIEPYLLEAESLLTLGKYKEAKEILEGFYTRDFILNLTDNPFVQNICINYALALRYTEEIDKAISVLRTLDKASNKSATYFLNLSMLYLIKKEWIKAETLCKEGIKKFPNDNELLGNLTISLTSQNKLQEAAQFSSARISISRNVNSLEEAAMILYKIAERKKNMDFPNAIKNYKSALSLLQEAKQLNPKFESGRLSISNVLFKLKKYRESSDEAIHIYNTTKVRKIGEIAASYIARNMLWTSSFEEGKAFCEKQPKFFPKSIFIKRVLSQILVEGYVINNYQDGVRVVEKSSLEFFTSVIQDKQNRLPSDFMYLAQIYAWMGDSKNLNKSIELLNEGIELYPDHWMLNYYVAAIYQLHGYLDEALIDAIEAKNKAPWRETTYLLISSIYNNKGDNIKTNKEIIYSQIES